MNQRFETMNKRFEAMDQRFETLTKDMNQRFEKIDQKFEVISENMVRGFDKMHVIITSFGARAGVRLEKTIVNLAKKSLEFRNINVSKIEYNKQIIDDGSYMEKGFKTHVDMYAHNSEVIFFDIKYQYSRRDMFDFIKRINIAEKYLKVKSSKRIIIALEISDEVIQESERRGLNVITIE